MGRKYWRKGRYDRMAVTCLLSLAAMGVEAAQPPFSDDSYEIQDLRIIDQKRLGGFTALAKGDFDEDGRPDLVVTTEEPTPFLLLISDIAGPSPKRARAKLSLGTAEVDYLLTGDFNADGHTDVVVAEAAASQLRWSAGDGAYGFGKLQTVSLPGRVSALLTADLNRPDGLADLAVAVESPTGPELLIFEHPNGALTGEPEHFALPADATFLASGQLDGSYETDLAVATNLGVFVLFGRDRKLSLDSWQRSRVRPWKSAWLASSSEVSAVSIGDYVEDARGRRELGVLTDGQIWSILHLGPGNEWVAVGQLLSPETGARPELTAAKDAWRLFGLQSGHQQHQKLHPAASYLVGRGDVWKGAGARTASVGLRFNGDAALDWVVLDRNSAGLQVAVSKSEITYTVNSIADTDDGSCDALGSGAGNQDCTLREAIVAANINADADSIVFGIPGDGPHSIRALSELPAITAPLFIDGYSQPTSVANTSPNGFNGVLSIELSGADAGVVSGLTSRAADVAIRGLIINDFVLNGIVVDAPGGNVIAGNIIGLDVTGMLRRPNGSSGLRIESDGHTVGGTAPEDRNVISANRDRNLLLSDAQFVQVMGNLIGPNISGTVDTPIVDRSLAGVQLVDGSQSNTIGGTQPGARNVISGNRNAGVSVAGNPGSNSNLIQGNYIGTDSTGTVALGNGGSFNDDGGIKVAVSSNNTIGGTVVSARNLISGNSSGILLTTGGSENLVQGNYIGTDAAGSSPVPNFSNGISMFNGSRFNIIGGTALGAGNLISGNGREGIRTVLSFQSIGGDHTIQGNLIGTDFTGTSALPNTDDGLDIATHNDLVGGTEAGAGNVISGNMDDGLELAAFNTVVQGNLIGTDITGQVGLPNAEVGIQIEGLSRDTLIGGENGGNTIAFNPQIGLLISNNRAGHTISRNVFHSNGLLGIDLGGGGVTANDKGDLDSGGPNDLQNFPMLHEVVTTSDSTTISGTLDSGTDNYVLEFFVNLGCDESGHGEGRDFIGSLTAASGDFQVTFDQAIAGGRVISSTATAENGSTSEFSACLAVPLGDLIFRDDFERGNG